ncbi:hypothetical protein [Streptomyces sp. WP-1]|nr:hypothetical protein [Streptomyces sp. WP-1]WKE67545.1 hypothetical protein QHG49_00085 [Streptomyces sp. WP-1]
MDEIAELIKLSGRVIADPTGILRAAKRRFAPDSHLFGASGGLGE